MTQFCPPGEFVSSNGILYNSSTSRVPTSVPRPFTSNFLPSEFAAQSKDNIRDIRIGDSGASCHVTNDATKMYCVRHPPLDQLEVTTSDGTRLRVECVGNIDVGIHGSDVSYVPGLRFNYFSFHKAQQTHVIILDTALRSRA